MCVSFIFVYVITSDRGYKTSRKTKEIKRKKLMIPEIRTCLLLLTHADLRPFEVIIPI